MAIRLHVRSVILLNDSSKLQIVVDKCVMFPLIYRDLGHIVLLYEYSELFRFGFSEQAQQAQTQQAQAAQAAEQAAAAAAAAA